MPYDAQHALEHPEVGAWVLGALDADDLRRSRNTYSTANSAKQKPPSSPR